MTLYKLGRYEIVEEIGSGGFATVFRGQDTVLQREVAVKVMRPLLMSDATFVARFQHEARIAAQLEHPNIIPIYDYGEVEGRLFLVMKLVRSGSLEKWLANGPIPFAEAVELFRQMAAGLDYAHEKKMVHRDLKPDNILIDERHHLYLADFGLVKALESSSLTSTISGGILGTPAYVGPEVWEGQPAGPAADIYALGCILYEMLVGQALFAGDTGPAVMLAHFRPANLPANWPDGIPTGLTPILQSALARDPNERYASVSVLAQQLLQLAAPQKKPPVLQPADPLAEPYAALQLVIKNEQWQEALNLVGIIENHNPAYQNVSELAQIALTGEQEAQKTVTIPQHKENSCSTKATVTSSEKLETQVPDTSVSLVEPAGIHQVSLEQKLHQSDSEIVKSRSSSTRSWLFALVVLTVVLAGATMFSIWQIEQVRLQIETTRQAEVQLTATRQAQQAQATATGYAQMRATATRQAQIQSTATRQAQEQRVVALTANGTTVFGPKSGSLIHIKGSFSKTVTDITLRDFVAEATFFNPYPVTAGMWDYGFLFRDIGENRLMLLIVSSDRRWRLINRGGAGPSQQIDDGAIPNLDTNFGNSNYVRLIAYSDRGWLYINDQLIAELDLSSRTNPGYIAVATGITVGHEIDRESTRYKDFTVLEIR